MAKTSLNVPAVFDFPPEPSPKPDNSRSNPLSPYSTRTAMPKPAKNNNDALMLRDMAMTPNL